VVAPTTLGIVVVTDEGDLDLDELAVYRFPVSFSQPAPSTRSGAKVKAKKRKAFVKSKVRKKRSCRQRRCYSRKCAVTNPKRKRASRARRGVDMARCKHKLRSNRK
jgi:hypothetical protein